MLTPVGVLRLNIRLAPLVAQTVKNLPAVRETWVRSSRLGRSPGEGDGYPLQYSGLEKSTDRGARQAAVHGVAESRTGLSDFSLWLILFCPSVLSSIRPTLTDYNRQARGRRSVLSPSLHFSF